MKLKLCRPAFLLILLGLWANIACAVSIGPGGGGAGSAPVYTPLDSWSFYADGTNGANWASDSGCLPVSSTNLGFSFLGDGASLVLATNVPAWLNFNTVEPSSGATNFSPMVGSLSCWFAPANWSGTNAGGAGPGQWALLFSVGETLDASNGCWGLAVDPPGANLWFLVQDGLGRSYSLAAPIAWTTNYFHYLCLTYCPTNVAIYLDGLLATNDPGGLNLEPPAAVLAGGIFFGSDPSGIFQAQGLFNSVKTYNVPLDAGTIQQTFTDDYLTYLLNPYNRAMFKLTSAPSSPSISSGTGAYDVISGSGDLVEEGKANCATNDNPDLVWLTNVTAVVAGNGTMTVTFTIAGGEAGVFYDVFANPVVGFGANTPAWSWMGQVQPCLCYSLSGMPNTACFLVLGTPQTTGWGLTDAYEDLVLQISPDGAQTDNYGVPYAWYAGHGLIPVSAGMGGQDPDADGLLNYQEYQYGTQPQVSEGMAIWVGAPNGTSGIP